ncbi:MAG: hypothetical protein DCC55_26800 [Chloroflexi bacterium]|nr:MAG: hypothetical protein DCC55_26800 [Chloroflexota bacterium]
MRKTIGMNKHQKAAHRPGEKKVSRASIPHLLELSCSSDVEDRLTAAQYLCPCHIQARIPEVWDAVFRMMEDEDRKVRFAAWHTWEDGGLPNDPAVFERMEHIYRQEKDPKVRRFAEAIIGADLAARVKLEMTQLHLASLPSARQRGKCDFCGEGDVWVTSDLTTTIPTATLPRAAWVCEACAQT